MFCDSQGMHDVRLRQDPRNRTWSLSSCIMPVHQSMLLDMPVDLHRCWMINPITGTRNRYAFSQHAQSGLAWPCLTLVDSTLLCVLPCTLLSCTVLHRVRSLAMLFQMSRLCSRLQYHSHAQRHLQSMWYTICTVSCLRLAIRSPFQVA